MATRVTTTTTVVEETTHSRTRVSLLLDKSGSMQTLVEATMEGFNTYIDTLKAAGDDIVFTLVQFDSMGLDTWPTQPVSKVPRLTRDNYTPRGGTPLIDAAYQMITATEEAAKPDEKVVICIQTDGQENASVKHKMSDLNLLIKRLTEKGWQFNFMGVNIDAYAQGTAMGISQRNTMTYGASGQHTASAFMSNATNTVGFASGALGGTAYSVNQKADAGDPSAIGGNGGASGGAGVASLTKVTPIKPLVDKPKID